MKLKHDFLIYLNKKIFWAIRIENLFLNWFGFIPIDASDRCLGLNQIQSDWFWTIFFQTKYKTFFGLVWNSLIDMIVR